MGRWWNRPSQDRTDTRDTRKTIGPFYNRENLRRNIYIYIHTVCVSEYIKFDNIVNTSIYTK